MQADVFISYSRTDAEAVRHLDAWLKNENWSVWVDWRGIPPSTEWLEQIFDAISNAKVFLFVLSERSVASEICSLELAHAASLGKRIVPVMIQPVDPRGVPSAAARHQWIDLGTTGDSPQGLERLKEALSTDPAWLGQHTALLRSTVEWERHDRDGSLLIRGKELAAAETALELYEEGSLPVPTESQRTFVLASRKAQIRRQRRGTSAALSVAVAAVLLSVFALISRTEAQKAQTRAQSETYVLRADRALTGDARLSALFAAESRRLAPTTENASALRAAVSGIGYRALLQGHTNALVGLAFADAGRIVATASSDGTARLWDTRDGRQRAVLDGHSDGLTDLAVSPDGERLVTAGLDGLAIVWDVASGREVAVLRGHSGAVTDVEISPDGQRIASASADHSVRIWDLASRRLIVRIDAFDGGVSHIRWSPDSSRVLATAALSVMIFDAATGSMTATLPVIADDQVAASFDATGHRALVADGAELLVVDVSRGGKVVGRLPSVLAPSGAMFSPDGRRVLAYGDEGSATVMDARTGEVKLSLPVDGKVTVAGYTSDGSKIVVASDAGMTRLFNARDGTQLTELGGQSAIVTDAAVSSDGDTVATASADSLGRLWRARPESGPMTIREEDDIGTAVYSPDGRRIATGSTDGIARVRSAQEGSRGRAVELSVPPDNPLERRVAPAVFSVAFSPQGNRVAVTREINLSSPAGDARIYAASDGALLAERSSAAFDAAFSPDGRRLAVAGADFAARILSADTGSVERTLEGHRNRVTSVAWCRDGETVVTGSGDQTARLWDVGTGRQIAILRGHRGPVVDVAFSARCDRVLTASEDDTARIWARDGRTLRVLRGHAANVTSAAFSHSGALVVTGGADNSARIWDVASGQALGALEHPGSVRTAVFSPDDSEILTAGPDSVARRWPCGVPCEPISEVALSARLLGGTLTQDEREDLEAGSVPDQAIGMAQGG